ncbi:hypothetical protein GC163_07105 [bacterium]|nr:hypothetical protein [bacterium]
MSDSKITTPHIDDVGPRGKVMGFLAATINAESLREALSDAGIEESRIEVFRGTDGKDRWDEMMGEETWGEQTEKSLKQGEILLERGGAIFTVQVADHHAAEQVAYIVKEFGVTSVMHFGQLVDTVLTV